MPTDTDWRTAVTELREARGVVEFNEASARIGELLATPPAARSAGAHARHLGCRLGHQVEHADRVVWLAVAWLAIALFLSLARWDFPGALLGSALLVGGITIVGWLTDD